VFRVDDDSARSPAGVFGDDWECCRHDRAPLRRLGIIRHERTGRRVYVLLCTECGFTVTTDTLRRMRGQGTRRRLPAGSPSGAPQWLPPVL